jgi:hypothetical protein
MAGGSYLFGAGADAATLPFEVLVRSVGTLLERVGGDRP